VELLFQDEASLYRQPSQASLYCPRGREQPRLHYNCSANTVMRVAGFLNACTGSVHSWDGSRITASRLARWFREISAIYPAAETIYIVMDNWPVHFHEKVERAVRSDPRICTIYAPWLNPIEKFWKLLKQRLVHAHDMSQDFNQFKLTVRQLLAQPTQEPSELLRYVGLIS
jgi:DDE superfamily endonuclease